MLGRERERERARDDSTLYRNDNSIISFHIPMRNQWYLGLMQQVRGFPLEFQVPPSSDGAQCTRRGIVVFRGKAGWPHVARQFYGV